jgi:CheY-like chemotaxis protein
MNNKKNASIEVLLVEDNDFDAKLLADTFKEGSINNSVSRVSNGAEAMEYLYQEGPYADFHRPDVIILDLNLPKKDGFEVLLDIKNNEQLKSIPVIILTTSSAEHDKMKSYALQASAFVTKPQNLSDFVKTVKAIEILWLSK